MREDARWRARIDRRRLSCSAKPAVAVVRLSANTRPTSLQASYAMSALPCSYGALHHVAAFEETNAVFFETSCRRITPSHATSERQNLGALLIADHTCQRYRYSSIRASQNLRAGRCANSTTNCTRLSLASGRAPEHCLHTAWPWLA